MTDPTPTPHDAETHLSSMAVAVHLSDDATTPPAPSVVLFTGTAAGGAFVVVRFNLEDGAAGLSLDHLDVMSHNPPALRAAAAAFAEAADRLEAALAEGRES